MYNPVSTDFTLRITWFSTAWYTRRQRERGSVATMEGDIYVAWRWRLNSRGLGSLVPLGNISGFQSVSYWSKEKLKFAEGVFCSSIVRPTTWGIYRVYVYHVYLAGYIGKRCVNMARGLTGNPVSFGAILGVETRTATSHKYAETTV